MNLTVCSSHDRDEELKVLGAGISQNSQKAIKDAGHPNVDVKTINLDCYT